MTKKTSNELAAKYARIYHEKAGEIANMIGKLDDMHGNFEILMEESDDNGDPYFDTAQALEKMGVLLASVVTYEHEYEADANAGNDKKDN